MPSEKEEAWRILWHRLQGEGWRHEVHNKCGDSKRTQNYFLPPGVKRGPGFKVRVHYFDARGQVFEYVNTSQANGVQAAQDAAVGTPGGDVKDQAGASTPALQLSAAPPAPVVLPELQAAEAFDQDLQKLQLKRTREIALQVHLMRSLLEVYSSSTSKAEIESTFAKLENLGPLSVEVLRETMIGRVLNTLTRRLSCPELQQRARALLASWRSGIRGTTGAEPAATGVPHSALRCKETPPEGVDPEVWPAIPADCREWAVSSSAQRTMRTNERISQFVANQPAVIDLCADAEEPILPSNAKRPRNTWANQSRVAHPEKVVNGQKKQDTCIICYTRPNTHAFVPCGHQCACGDCGSVIIHGCGATCPICRGTVTMAIQIYG